MRRTLLTTIVVLTAAVAGCGTSGDEAGPDPATPTAPADSSGTSTPDDATGADHTVAGPG